MDDKTDALTIVAAAAPRANGSIDDKMYEATQSDLFGFLRRGRVSKGSISL